MKAQHLYIPLGSLVARAFAEHNTKLRLKSSGTSPKLIFSHSFCILTSLGRLSWLWVYSTLMRSVSFLEELCIDDSAPSSRFRLLWVICWQGGGTGRWYRQVTAYRRCAFLIGLFSVPIFFLWSLQTGEVTARFESPAPSHIDISYFKNNTCKKIIHYTYTDSLFTSLLLCQFIPLFFTKLLQVYQTVRESHVFKSQAILKTLIFSF